MIDRLRFLFNYPIRYVLPMSMLLLLAVSLVWGYTVSLQREYRVIESNAIARTQMDLAFLQDSIEHAAARGHSERPQQLLGALAINVALQSAFLADETGIVSASMEREDIGRSAVAVILHNTAYTPGLEAFLQQVRTRQRSLMQLSENRLTLYGFHPVSLPPQQGTLAPRRGWLYMQRDLTTAKAVAERDNLYVLAQTLGPVIFFSLVILIMSHYGITRRLARLLSQAEAIGTGNLRAESRLVGRDEFAVLSRALDSMAERLQRNQDARQRAEEVLKESESVLSSFYSAVPLRMAMVQLLGNDLVVVRANPAMANDFGATPGTVQYRRVSELADDALLQTWRLRMLESQDRGVPVNFEYNWRTNGTELYMSATTVHVPGTASGRTYFAVLVDNITERKRIEKALRASEAEYRSLFDDALDLIVLCGRDGEILDANQSQLEALGCQKGEVVGRQLLDFVHAADRDLMAAQIERVNGGQTIRDFPLTMTGRSGHVVHAVMNAFPHFDRAGRVVQIRAMMRDITDRKQKDKLLESILNTAIDGVVTTNGSGIIQMANSAAARILGTDLLHLPGKNLLKYVQHDSIEGLYSEPPLTVLKGTRESGAPFPVELGISRFELDSSEYYTVFFRDVTLRRSLEEQLDHSRRMEAVGKLAGGIAHDFNNLLMVILGYSEVLLAKDSDQAARKSIQAIQQAAERGAALTQQLLTFSRKQSREPEPVDMNRIVGTAEQMLRRLLGENIILTSSLADDLLPVIADKSQMEQIVLNLALNARDAMPDGGRLTIETGNVYLDEEFCQSRSECTPGKYVCLTVTDTGIGMSPEIQARIFEPFFTTKAPGKGTGLGLATVYGCVHQNGGIITVSSHPGRGTIFEVYLPATTAVFLAAPEAARPERIPAGAGETILLVEDEDGVRAIARLALENAGYRVIEAPDAHKALDLAETSPLTIDLLLTDIVMPGMSGRQLADRMREKIAGGRILLMTGYTEDPSASSYPLIRKPFTPRALAERVRAILDSDPDAAGAGRQVADLDFK